VFKVFGPASMSGRKSSEWGVLSAWAWGASRIMDWVETVPQIDAKHVGVVGLSRNGKAALLTGVTDRRFAMTVSCCSGCGGAKLNRFPWWESEHIKQVLDIGREWFCPAFAGYAGKDRKLPFDQHQYLSLIAPRLLYVSSGSEDAWACPRAEFASAAEASPVWELYRKAGLVHHGFPKPDHPLHAGNIGYHLRSGLHDITRYDWQCYLDFADGHGWRFGGDER
jgi:dienelactone hydrolase